MWKQLVQPDLSVKEAVGNCLIFSRKVFSAPAGIPSAREGWDFTKFKHADKNLPNVSVPVWFDHTGTYGKPPVRKNWGHVAVYVPGKGILSSPTSGFGQRWFTSIEQLEKVMPAKYLGWSEDINGKRVAINQGGEDMPITKEQEQVVAILATGSLPGANYNYQFVGTNNLDGMLNFWRTQPDMVGQLADKRLAQLNSIGAEVNVGAPVDDNGVQQVITNIRTQRQQIDDVTKIAEDRLKDIENLKKQPVGDYVEVGNNTGLFQRKKK